MRDGCGRGNSLKLLLLGPQRVERDERHAIVGACHRTSNGQEHKIIRSLGSFTGAGDFVLQLIRLESLGSELTREQTTFFCGS